MTPAIRTCTAPPRTTGARNSPVRNRASALANRFRASLRSLDLLMGLGQRKTGARCKFQELLKCLAALHLSRMFVSSCGRAAGPGLSMVLHALARGKRVLHDFQKQLQLRRPGQERHEVRQRVVVPRELERVARQAGPAAGVFELV